MDADAGAFIGDVRMVDIAPCVFDRDRGIHRTARLSCVPPRLSGSSMRAAWRQCAVPNRCSRPPSLPIG